MFSSVYSLLAHSKILTTWLGTVNVVLYWTFDTNLNPVSVYQIMIQMFPSLTGLVTLWEKEIRLENALHIYARVWCWFWTYGSCFFDICSKVSREAGTVCFTWLLQFNSGIVSLTQCPFRFPILLVFNCG